jgi:hypothetical protein
MIVDIEDQGLGSEPRDSGGLNPNSILLPPALQLSQQDMFLLSKLLI